LNKLKKFIILKGIMAQELREVIPDAVVESGNIVLENGDLVENFLHVNKVNIYLDANKN